MPGAEWWSIATRSGVVRRALKTSAVVGTVLVLINQGPALLAGEVDGARWVQIALTYLVPYCVATYAAVGATLDTQSRNAPDA